MIPTEAVERIKDALPISQVVMRRVKLRRSGRTWAGLCPFHKEKTPSFTVDDARGTWHCFGACNTGGDIVEFCRRAYGWSFREAVEELAREAGVDLPKPSPEAIRQEAHRLSLVEVLEAAAEWFRDQLARSDQARAYLKGRGITDGQIAGYDIGFAPDERSGLKAALGERCGLNALSQAGLIVAGEGVAVSYDRFRGRIVFPVRDHRGRVVSFSGRYIGTGDAPKYLNGPETDVFHKGAVLFNAHRARQPAHETGVVVVTEGQFDVLAVEAAGFPAVAPMGTALTEDHVKGLWRMADVPVLAFDGDAAGIKAAARAMATTFPLLRPGRSVRVAWMPAGSDPDSLARGKGLPALKAVLGAPEGLADAFWRVSIAGKGLEGPDARGKLEADMVEAFAAIPDGQLRRKYVDDARQRIRSLGKPRPIIRSNGHSHHSANPAGFKLMHGLPPEGRFTLKEAAVLANLIRMRDIDEREPSGLSDRARQVMAEIHHLIASLPDEEFLAALKGNVGGEISEAFDVLHSAGVTDYDIEGLH